MVEVNKWEDPDSENLMLQFGNLLKGVDPTGATSAMDHPTVESLDETEDQVPGHHVNERSPEANSAAFEGLNAANLRMFADHRTHSQRSFEDGGAVNRGTRGCLITDLQ